MGCDAPPNGVPGAGTTAIGNRLLGYLIAAVVLGSGCRPPTASVEGAVTFDGNPLRIGAIQFFPLGGDYREAASATVVDGRYRIPVVTVGPKVVSVRGVKNESRGPEPEPLPEDLDGNDLTLVLGPGRHTIDLSLETP